MFPNAEKLLLLISSTLILSYIGSTLYKKTKIPDIIWILIFGIILGPVLGYFDKKLFLSISPLMSTVALSIILFDAGITTNFKMIEKTFLKSTVLALSTFVSVVLILGYSLSYFLPESFTLQQGFLLGSMIGGTSTIAVFGIINGLEKIIPKIESTKVLLMMESVISDPVCIITAISIIRMIMLPEVSINDSFMEIFIVFILSSGFGLVIGLIWAEFLHILRGRHLLYMITLAILFPTYLTVENIIGEGGGPMAALVFGLTITNYSYMLRKININRSLRIDIEKIIELHEEITFFIKAFFFVYIGLIVTISIDYIKIGLLITGLILIIRFIIASLAGKIMKFNRKELVISRLIFAQGLPAFVMSQLPLIYDPQKSFFLDPSIFPNLCMPIVLCTVLIAAILSPIIAQRQLK